MHRVPQSPRLVIASLPAVGLALLVGLCVAGCEKGKDASPQSITPKQLAPDREPAPAKPEPSAATRPHDRPAGEVPATQAALAGTLDNLMTAFNGESNAQAKYVAYAKRADEEGYARVAALFRAAAEAEGIHAANHAAVIKELGGAPKADIKLPTIGATADNLEDAIKGESYERDTMYPQFLAQARKENQKAAVKSFNFAKAAEAGHVELYTGALESLDDWEKAGKGFYVCPTCGKTVENIGFDRCPICMTGKEKFKLVS